MKSPTMKAVVMKSYGSPDVLEIQEVAKPSPEANEILIKIHATTVTTADTMMRKADPFISRFFLGFNRPKNPITGTGFAGVIEAVGAEVTSFKIGEAVFGETSVKFSANAEYVAIPAEGVVVRKPANITFEEAATMTDGPLTSLNFLKELAKVKPGQSVLINGASGSLGTAAVQLAKAFGAQVTGVSGPNNVELVKSLGADHVIDYSKQDFTQNLGAYDIIYDTVGKSSFSSSKKALKPNGIYLSPKLGFGLLLQMLKTSFIGNKKALFSATGLLPVPELRKLIDELKTIIESGKLKTVIDRYYPLEQTPDAHRYVDTGHKKGNVVIRVV